MIDKACLFWYITHIMSRKKKNLDIKQADLWYLVGLITSDGYLSKDGRHIDITSKEYDFLQNIVNRLKLNNKVTPKTSGSGGTAYRIQIANQNFYDFLLSIELMPNKSLVLRDIDVLQQYFIDFLRGVIDGDGSIRQWVHPSNAGKQWSLRIYSSSKIFIVWLRQQIEVLLNARGKLYEDEKTTHTLKYGKMAAREILSECYYEGCFGLQRKIALAKDCALSDRGWSKSKTVITCL